MLDYLNQPLYKGKSLVLPQLDVSCYVQVHGRPAPFWMETKEQWVEGKGDRWELGKGRG